MDHNGDDISLLQRPLRTAHTGFEEARRAYEDGTNEVSPDRVEYVTQLWPAMAVAPSTQLFMFTNNFPLFPQVRQLLSLECSLIYECKVCRNMFRSLANFISHKRVFCCVSARSANGSDTVSGQ